MHRIEGDARGPLAGGNEMAAVGAEREAARLRLGRREPLGPGD